MFALSCMMHYLVTLLSGRSRRSCGEGHAPGSVCKEMLFLREL